MVAFLNVLIFFEKLDFVTESGHFYDKKIGIVIAACVLEINDESGKSDIHIFSFSPVVFGIWQKGIDNKKPKWYAVL